MQLCIRLTARRENPATAGSPALWGMLADGALSHPEDPPLSRFSPLWSDLCVLYYTLGVTGNTEYSVGVSLGTHRHQAWSSKKAQVQGKALSTKYRTRKIRDMYVL